MSFVRSGTVRYVAQLILAVSCFAAASAQVAGVPPTALSSRYLAEIVVRGQDWEVAKNFPEPSQPGRMRYIAQRTGGILNLADGSRSPTFAKELYFICFVVRSTKDLYATTETALWHITPTGKTTKLDDQLLGGNGLAFSPDGQRLLVAQSKGRFLLEYRVKADGRVDSSTKIGSKKSVYEPAVPRNANDAGTTYLAFDTQGRAYAATRLGVQIFDRNGRLLGILPAPVDEALTGLTFGDADSHMLYIFTETGKIYKRRVKPTGYLQSAAPEGR